MQFHNFAVFGLAVIICGTSGGCHIEYQANFHCDCFTVDGDYWHCSAEAAAAEVAAVCPNDGKGTFTYEERLVFNFSGCPDDRDVPFLPEAVGYIVDQAGQLAGITHGAEAVEAGDEPACPVQPGKVNMKVTGFYEGANAGQEVPRKFTVKYTKKLETGNEEVVLTAMVPLGGQHEFICTDAEVTDVAGEGYVSSLRASFSFEAGLETCGQATLASIPWDSSGVELHHNDNGGPENRCELIIVPAANPAAAAKDAATATDGPELIPMPDPTFSQSDR